MDPGSAKLTDFWCRSLLQQSGYEGNRYRKHQDVHEGSPMRIEHFARWLDLFHEAISAWSGPLVEQAKSQAALVASVHSYQITGVRYEHPATSPQRRIRLCADPRS